MRDCRPSNIPKSDQMSFLEFHLNIADVLIKHDNEKPTVGRSRKSEQSSNKCRRIPYRRFSSGLKRLKQWDACNIKNQSISGREETIHWKSLIEVSFI